MPRLGISVSDLDDMIQVARVIVAKVRDGADPMVDDVATLATFVDQLAAEVDQLHWRATVAAMALDGRLHHGEINVGTQ